MLGGGDEVQPGGPRRRGQLGRGVAAVGVDRVQVQVPRYQPRPRPGARSGAGSGTKAGPGGPSPRVTSTSQRRPWGATV